VSKKLLTALALVVLALGAVGCATTDQTANANVNAAGTTTTRTAADGSEITTTTDASGVKTETRVFRNNPRVSRVVVTTRDGRRTVRAYSPKGEEKEINDVGDVLEATGDKIADAAGWTADKTKDVVDEAADKLEDVGDKTASGAKKVGKKTVQGAKKAGSAIKDAVTP
jgi:hypothetical protein